MNLCPTCGRDRDFVHERDSTYMCSCTDERATKIEHAPTNDACGELIQDRLKIGTRVIVHHQPARDRLYIESERSRRQRCNGRTGVVIDEHDSHGLCYEVRFLFAIVTYDREELELA